MRGKMAIVTIVAAGVLAPVAGADYGVHSVSPHITQAGRTVEVRTNGPRMPIAIVPWEKQPGPVPCGNRLCSPRYLSPPRRAPFVWVGRTNDRGRLRFRVPHVRPGIYAFVLFCDVCYKGSGARLVEQGDVPYEQLLHIKR